MLIELMKSGQLMRQQSITVESPACFKHLNFAESLRIEHLLRQ